jgi:cytoskeleton protein RodZ
MDHSAENIGHILQQKRQALGLSLDDVAEQTRIRMSHLESLEENRFDDLPGPTYVTGFLRIYARFLGLDSDALLAGVNDLQRPEFKPLRAVQSTRKQPRRAQRKRTGRLWRGVLFVLLVALVLAGGFYLLPDRWLHNPLETEPVMPTPSPAETTVPAQSSPPAVSEAPAPAAVPLQTASLPTEAPAEVAEEDPAKVIAEGPAEVQPEATAEAPPLPVEPPPESPARSLPAIPPAGAPLRMLAVADSSLLIDVDNRPQARFELNEGLDLTWRVKESVSVNLADPDVARFWLNNREIDVSGLTSFTLEKTVDE